MYQSCFATANLQTVGWSIFHFDVVIHSEHIKVLIGNTSGRWFQDNSFNEILFAISETRSIIDRRYVPSSARRWEEQQSLTQQLENEIVSKMPSAMDPSFLDCIRNGLEEAESLLKPGSIRRSLPVVGMSVLASMLLVEGEHILTDFCRARPDHQHTEAEYEYPFSFIETLKPSLGASVSLGELQEVFSRLLNLRSKYMLKKETFYAFFAFQNDPVEAAMSLLINRQPSHGQSTITEILAGFVDLLMTNTGDGSKQSQLKKAVQILSMSSTKMRFRLLSQQYMARRLLRKEEIGTLKRIELERNLMNILSRALWRTTSCSNALPDRRY